MKTPTAITVAASLLAAVLTVPAFAQTGRPSEAPSDRSTVAVAGSDEVGSYARYLMLNGKPREVALEAARNVDHPAPSKHFALRSARSKS